MSQENIGAKIFSLTNVLKGLAYMEMICLNSRDNFEDNKLFIKKRISEETDEVITNLLKKGSLSFRSDTNSNCNIKIISLGCSYQTK